MIFTSRNLERALARGEVTGWHAAQYYFVPMIFTSVVSTPIWLLQPRYSIYPKPSIYLTQFLLQVLAGVLVYYGMKKCFRTNDQIDGRDFIRRMVILAFPVYIKIVGVTVVASLTLLNLAVRIFSCLHPQVLTAAISPLITFVMFKLINESLRRFGNEGEESQQTPA